MQRRTVLLGFAVIAFALMTVGVFMNTGLTVGVLVGLASMMVSLYIIGRIDPREEMRLAVVLCIAVGLRWLCSAGVELVIYPTSPGLFAPDEIFYAEGGRAVADYWAGRGPDPVGDYYLPGVSWVTGAFFYLFGNYGLIPKIFAGVISGWAAVLTALIAQRVYNNPRVAHRAGLLAAVFPSLVLWGSLNCKDGWTLFGAELSLLAFLELRRNLRPWLVAVMVAGVFLTGWNRFYETIFLAVGVVGSFAFSLNSGRRAARNFIGALVLSLVVLVIMRQNAGTGGLTDAALESPIETLTTMRGNYASDAASAVNVGLVDTTTPLGLLLWLPIGVAYFLLAPVPFTGTSIISIATSPEMLLWYTLLPSLVRGLRDAIRGRMQQLSPALLFAAAGILTWSMSITNVGTMYRYRSQVLFVLLILIAADQIRRKELRERRRAQAMAFPPLGSFAHRI